MKPYKLGITFGAFDPLHYGHIKIFERAKEQCEELIVVVSTADYIEKNKNRKERVPFVERSKAVSAIRYVSRVSRQTLTRGKKEVIDKLRPDVIFVGDDWNRKTFTGEGLGVPVIYLPHTDGISSTELSKKNEK